ncbi:hypothetical protein [Labedella endophytica]|uniref:Uncharacterized protein n=1 Tax=Labedella endophytica TaxID=1523160 RepID=A0A433JQB8_9MICO|nr:hypothetical protein [Labedella endophytica]RUQ99163.1 hypothetical protein ELQ94_12690 [Labedella endophytica]
MASAARRRRERSSEPPTDHRFVEPPIGSGRLAASTLFVTVTAILAGSGIGFLVTLGLWLTLEEAFPDVWREWGLDPVSRLNLGGTSLVAAAAGALYPIALSLDRFLLGRQLARLAVEEPLDVPPLTVRNRGLKQEPVTPVLILSRVVIGVAIAVAGVDVLLWAETDDTFASMIVLGVAVFTIGGLVAVNGVLKESRRHGWPELIAEPRRVWSEKWIAAARRAETTRRPPLGGAPAYGRLHAVVSRSFRPLITGGSALVGAGAVVHFIGVYIRQPGRRASPRSYDDVGEDVIDVLSGSGAIVVTIGLLLLVLSATVGTAEVALERAALRRALVGRPADGPDRRVIENQLIVLSPLVTTGAALVGVATMVLEPVGAAIVVARGPLHPLGAVIGHLNGVMVGVVVVLLVGVVFIATGTLAARAFRERLRTTWHPGDDPTAVVATTAKRRRTDDDGEG